jgi:four helix bundle protein
MEQNSKNIIITKTVEFAVLIIEFAEILEGKRKYAISRQVIRSGTSIGANVQEAQNAESKADFIHKMKIAAKEANETEYWLLLCQLSKTYPNCEELQMKAKEINKILTKIITTIKNRR